MANKIGDKTGPKPGRPKGALNKNTALLKDAILMAADQAGGGKNGLVKYLVRQANQDNPAPFMALLGKVLPMQVVGPDDEDGRPGAIEISFVGTRSKG